MTPKIVNHYGYTVNSDNPITGVIGINQINSQALFEAMDYEGGINLDEEERLEEFKLQPFFSEYGIELNELSEEAQSDIIELVNDSIFDISAISFSFLSEDTQEELLQLFYDRNESYPDDIWLIGSWTKDKDGYYIPDEMDEYAAIVNESTIQVVWSIHTIRVLHLCSPCYPGQADIQTDNDNQPIESDNGYLTYNLPIEFYTVW